LPTIGERFREWFEVLLTTRRMRRLGRKILTKITATIRTDCSCYYFKNKKSQPLKLTFYDGGGVFAQRISPPVGSILLQCYENRLCPKKILPNLSFMV